MVSLPTKETCSKLSSNQSSGRIQRCLQDPCTSQHPGGQSGSAGARSWGTRSCSHKEAPPTESYLLNQPIGSWLGCFAPNCQLHLTKRKIWQSGYILLVSALETSKKKWSKKRKREQSNKGNQAAGDKPSVPKRYPKNRHALLREWDTTLREPFL